MNNERNLKGYFDFVEAIAKAELLIEKLNKEKENKEEAS